MGGGPNGFLKRLLQRGPPDEEGGSRPLVDWPVKDENAEELSRIEHFRRLSRGCT